MENIILVFILGTLIGLSLWHRLLIAELMKKVEVLEHYKKLNK